MIYDIKNEPLLQVSSQDTSTSFNSQIQARSKSCLIFIKLLGYLPNHLPTSFMMSKMTQFSKSPVRNPQRPPSPKFRPDLNHVGSSSNFQDIFLIIYQHNWWCQSWPNPPRLRSETINVLQVPNEARQLNLVGSSSNFQDIFLIIYFSARSCRIFIKLLGYLPDHLPT